MRKYVSLLFLIGAFSLAAADDDLKEFKDMTDLSAAVPVLTENFNGGSGEWTLPEGWSYEPREGLTGSGALKYVRTDPDKDAEARLYIDVKPGIRYRLSLQYRSELKEEADKARMEIFAIRYWDADGKKLPGSFYNRKKMNSDRNDWEGMEFTFQPPAAAKTAALCLLMRVKRTGTLWFDDIVIAPYSSELAMLHITNPKKLSLNEYGDVSWKCTLTTAEKKPQLAVEATVGGRTKRIPVDEKGNAKAAFGKFEPGKIPVEAKLLDLDGKRILAVDRCHVFVHPERPEKVSGCVDVEYDGRVLIDGQPFMPVGLFASMIVEKNDAEALRKIKDAGFNTILSIGYVNPYGGLKDTPEETLTALCDELHKLGLKYIFAIKHQLELPPGKKPRGRREWGRFQGAGVIADMTVETLKDHPAMLAWYVSDENALDEIPAIRALRERISERDPLHPILTLTDKVGNFQHFAKTGDVLLHDVYPIGWRTNSGPEQTLKTERDAFDPAWDTGLPVWWVPQVFPWCASSLENVPRYPTEDEMTGQCLLAAIHGVKAFLLYSWHHAMYLSEQNDPGHSAEQWERICKTVSTLRSLEPFIMSREDAPAVMVENALGNGVEAAAFRSGEKICVMIVSIGPGPAAADIVIRGCPGLKSRTGRTEDLGDGRYRFKGENISYDILELNPT